LCLKTQETNKKKEKTRKSKEKFKKVDEIPTRYITHSDAYRWYFAKREIGNSPLNRKVGQIQIQFFGKANGGSFQFFPSMILFRKNHWTKQVFRRGERFL